MAEIETSSGRLLSDFDVRVETLGWGSGGRRFGPVIRGYLLRQLAASLAVVLGAFTLVVVVADLVGWSDLIVNRGFGAREVGMIAFYRLLPVVGQTLPFGVLVAILATLGRMTSSRELLALESSGVNPLRLSGPVVGFGLAAALASLRRRSRIRAPRSARARWPRSATRGSRRARPRRAERICAAS
jgi:hypothetical protein